MDRAALLGNVGAKPTIVYQGVSYPVSWLTDRLRVQFSEWLKTCARKELLANRELFDAASWAAQVVIFQNDCKAGVYEVGGEFFREIVTRSMSASVEFLRVLLAPDSPTVTDEIVEAILVSEYAQVELALAQVQDALPKAQTPSQIA